MASRRANLSYLPQKCAVSYADSDVVTLYLSAVGETFDSYSAGWCGPLTSNVSSWLRHNGVEHKRLMITRAVEEGNQLYPSAKNQPQTVWYHAIIVLNGIVHCPWLNQRLNVEAYCNKMFPGQRITIEEDYNCCTTMPTTWAEAA